MINCRYFMQGRKLQYINYTFHAFQRRRLFTVTKAMSYNEKPKNSASTKIIDFRFCCPGQELSVCVLLM